ncbi:MAG: glycosyltransferase family 2 protein, partial [Microcoleus sp. T3-bin5]|nr:glycosyltransferase family 2 protein [Microcoleus sp. T3-bin5]
MPALSICDGINSILSVLANQTAKLWEVILVDNGSTDGSKRIAACYADRLANFKVVSATEQAGAAYARNVGVRAATGDYLAFCDADNIADLGWVAAFCRAFA